MKKIWDYDKCNEVFSKCKTIDELKTNYPSAFACAQINGWYHELRNKYIPRKRKEKVPNGYWSIYENNRNAASECSSRGEFSKKYGAAHKIASKNGWLETYDFFKDKKFWGDGKVDSVYAYFFEEQNAVYVGRTLMVLQKNRDAAHRNGQYHKRPNKDTVYRYSKENNIPVPRMTILIDNLTISEGQEKEDFYVKQFIKEGWKVLNKAKTGKGSSSIGALGKRRFTDEQVIELMKKYDNKTRFTKENWTAADYAKEHNLFSLATWFKDTSTLLSDHMHKRWGSKKFTEEDIISKLKECNSRKEMNEKYHFELIQAEKKNLIRYAPWYNEKIANARKFTKPIAQIDPRKGEIIKVFSSIAEAERELKLNYIGRKLKKDNNSLIGGFRWEFVNK